MEGRSEGGRAVSVSVEFLESYHAIEWREGRVGGEAHCAQP